MHGVFYDVHPQRAAVAHVVSFVSDLLFEDGREDCGGRREWNILWSFEIKKITVISLTSQAENWALS